MQYKNTSTEKLTVIRCYRTWFEMQRSLSLCMVYLVLLRSLSLSVCIQFRLFHVVRVTRCHLARLPSGIR